MVAKNNIEINLPHPNGKMTIGDYITVIGVPKGLDDETKTLLNLCVGRTFRIVGIVAVPETEGELFELHVGEVLGQPDYMHSIWIEEEFATTADAQS